MDDVFLSFLIGENSDTGWVDIKGSEVHLPTEKDGKIIYSIDCAGLKKEDIKVTNVDGVVKIVGKTVDFLENEFYVDKIVPLPSDIDKDNVKKKLINGIMYIICERVKEKEVAWDE